MTLLPGHYSGPAPADPREPGAPAGRLFHKIVPITAPQFGAQYVFYHQISRDGFDSSQPFQQKIYAFDLDPKRSTNRMRSVVFYPQQGYANLEQHAAQLASLDPTVLMQFPESCAIRWLAGERPGVFVARVSRSDCQYVSKAFKQIIAPDLTYVLSEAEFAIEDVLYGENGQPLFPPSGLLHATRLRTAAEP
ncbi:MAG TPA: hypothetical protein P5528_05485 [Steroidobacteraceae bacterium]|nr:hypothetical protein [Steroidobacteraceae bacterium]HRX88880.1 hypothetical protein [Steroidobacteraceae bacterium]